MSFGCAIANLIGPNDSAESGRYLDEVDVVACVNLVD
jgi:hypothetical protein|tara:strand:+ start:5949 stop:6059 length:111 start_codon:yes stop_codon:yes gene_type:complete